MLSVNKQRYSNVLTVNGKSGENVLNYF